MIYKLMIMGVIRRHNALLYQRGPIDELNWILLFVVAGTRCKIEIRDIIIYWVSKFIYSCFLLVKNVSRDSGEILLSPWQRS